MVDKRTQRCCSPIPAPGAAPWCWLGTGAAARDRRRGPVHRLTATRTPSPSNTRRLRELISELEGASLRSIETAEGWTDKP